ncbi:MAG: tetratricopeptide repeat protein, partial [Methylococcales bacterium]
MSESETLEQFIDKCSARVGWNHGRVPPDAKRPTTPDVFARIAAMVWVSDFGSAVGLADHLTASALLRSYSNLGAAWRILGDAEKAIDYYEKALLIDLQVIGDQHPNVARNNNNLGEAWRNLGDAKKAIDYYKNALSIDLQVFGDQHPNVAIDYNN